MPDRFRSTYLLETRTTTSVSGLGSPVRKEGSDGRGFKNPEGGSQDRTILNLSLSLCVLCYGFEFVFARSLGLLYTKSLWMRFGGRDAEIPFEGFLTSCDVLQRGCSAITVAFHHSETVLQQLLGFEDA
jgi:hypothetical protein